MRHIKTISNAFKSDLSDYTFKKFIGKITDERRCYVTDGEKVFKFETIFDAIEHILDNVRSDDKEYKSIRISDYITLNIDKIGYDYGYQDVKLGYDESIDIYDLKKYKSINVDVIVKDKRFVSKLNRMFSNKYFVAGVIKFLF
jgi:hypothetical protein